MPGRVKAVCIGAKATSQVTIPLKHVGLLFNAQQIEQIAKESI